MMLVNFYNARNVHKLTVKLATRGSGSQITNLTPKAIITLNGICDVNCYSWLPHTAKPGRTDVPFVDLSELTKD